MFLCNPHDHVLANVVPVTSSTPLYISIMSASADDQHEHVNDQTGDGVPGGDSKDNAYASRPSQGHIPIQSDDAPVEDPIDPVTADTDEQLSKPDAFSIHQH